LVGLQDTHFLAAINVALAAAKNIRILRDLQQRRKKRMLRFKAQQHDRIGLIQFWNEAGPLRTA